MEIGKYNTLQIKKTVDFGVYLDGEDGSEILLPTQYLPETVEVGEYVQVFIYKDSEDRVIATNLIPKVTVGEFGYLEVKDVNQAGAFLDWGLLKDLMVPYREQVIPMVKGKSYWVYAFVDDRTERIVASSHLNRYVGLEQPELEAGQEVEIFTVEPTLIGMRVIVESKYWGIVFKNEVFRELKVGEKLRAYVKNVREDGKVDISLQKLGYDEVEEAVQRVLDRLASNEGFLPFHDKSDPAEIYESLQMSKKTFKKAVGALYKQKKIELSDRGINLI